MTKGLCSSKKNRCSISDLILKYIPSRYTAGAKMMISMRSKRRLLIGILLSVFALSTFTMVVNASFIAKIVPSASGYVIENEGPGGYLCSKGIDGSHSAIGVQWGNDGTLSSIDQAALKIAVA